jgi:hypothetical protein
LGGGVFEGWDVRNCEKRKQKLNKKIKKWKNGKKY